MVAEARDRDCSRPKLEHGHASMSAGPAPQPPRQDKGALCRADLAPNTTEDRAWGGWEEEKKTVGREEAREGEMSYW